MKSKQRAKLLVLVPGEGGGIYRLFEQLSSAGADDGSFELVEFNSKGAGWQGVVFFPIRLVRFFLALIRLKPVACHINLASRGSALRKLLYAALCQLARVPYVIHLHGGRYPEFFSGLPRWAQTLVSRFFRSAAKVVVLGKVWRDFVIKEIGVDAARVVILPNAVRGPEGLNVGKPELPHILFLGLLGPGKGVPELVSALTSPHMEPLAWRATLAGDGDVSTTREAVATAGQAGRIAVPGWVGPDDVQNLLDEAHILVLPSHAENLPLSMLEGMGYGLCPVVTPVGAVLDVIRDGENGLIVPVGDADALGDALARVVSDKNLRERLASQARRDFEASYDIRGYRKKLEEIYLDVLSEGSR